MVPQLGRKDEAVALDADKHGVSSVTVNLPRDNLFLPANLRRLMEQASQGKRRLQ